MHTHACTHAHMHTHAHIRTYVVDQLPGTQLNQIHQASLSTSRHINETNVTHMLTRTHAHTHTCTHTHTHILTSSISFLARISIRYARQASPDDGTCKQASSSLPCWLISCSRLKGRLNAVPSVACCVWERLCMHV